MRVALNSDRADPTPDDERALAARAARDRDAFAALYRRHVPIVYRFLLARLGNVQAAEEVTAQTFEAALTDIGRFEGRSSLSTWLLAIARRHAADHFRRNPPTLPLDAAASLAADTPSLDELAARGLRLDQVAALMRALAPDRAEALALRLFAGLSVAEAAQVMGKSEAAVKMLVHRAVRDVRARLAPAGEEIP